MKKYISWRRVSTFKQNKSGLGMENQKDIINYFVQREGGEVIADYAECYTGKELSGCTELRRAMQHAKAEDAVLVIAKTDRFRNTIEALQIYEEMGDGNIMFCDLPHTDKFTLTLFFALAEREALITSIRTSGSLKALKKKGVKLGAANDTYKKNYDMKTEIEIKEIGRKRGMTRNRHKLESRDTQAFIKVLQRVFEMEGDPEQWDWQCISVGGGRIKPIVQLMQDFKDIDDTGKTFIKWDLSEPESKTLYHRVAAYIANLKKSIMYNLNKN